MSRDGDILMAWACNGCMKTGDPCHTLEPGLALMTGETCVESLENSQNSWAWNFSGRDVYRFQTNAGNDRFFVLVMASGVP